jgi:regulator of sigma E protease
VEITYKILAFLAAIFVLVLVHEYGHFIVARWCKVKILRFSIGFGKALYTWKSRRHRRGHDDTEFVLAMIPLGGYIKMLDSREMKVEPAERHLAFDYKPAWQRALIILAGPCANIIFGAVVLWALLTIGITAARPMIGEVKVPSIAYAAGLRAGDEIVAVAGKPVNNWQKIVFPLFTYIGDDKTVPIGVVSAAMSRATAPRTHLAQTQTTKYLNLSGWRLDEWQPDPLRDLGVVPYQPSASTVIGKILPDGPAAQSELRVNDKVISINGVRPADWAKMTDFIKERPEQSLHFVVERARAHVDLAGTSAHRKGVKQVQVVVVAGWRFGPGWKKIGYIGVQPIKVQWAPEMTQKEQYSLFGAFMPAMHEAYEIFSFNFIMLHKLVSKKLSMHVLGGPIGVFQSAAFALQHGAVAYLGFMAFLSLALAFINLLPIPALDGGHILLLLIEAIRRKPFSVAMQMLIVRIGMVLLILLMVQAMINDLRRLF